jgi:hypothetical protein
LNPHNELGDSLKKMSNGLISYVDNTDDLTLYPKLYTMINDGYITTVTPKFSKDVMKYYKTHHYNDTTDLQKKINILACGPKCRARSVSSMVYEDAPKIEKLLYNIKRSNTTHKHLVYVNEKQAGSRIIEHYLHTYAGMKLYDGTSLLMKHGDFRTNRNMPNLNNMSVNKTFTGSTFAVLNTSGSQTKTTQSRLLNIFNSVDNKNGDIIKLLIIQGKSFLRASTFKAVRYLHILTPLIDINEYQQLIGRVRRRCSHNQLTKSKWTVAVIPYMIANSPDTEALKIREGKMDILTKMVDICKGNAIDRHVYNKNKMIVNVQSGSLLNL